MGPVWGTTEQGENSNKTLSLPVFSVLLSNLLARVFHDEVSLLFTAQCFGNGFYVFLLEIITRQFIREVLARLVGKIGKLCNGHTPALQNDSDFLTHSKVQTYHHPLGYCISKSVSSQ